MAENEKTVNPLFDGTVNMKVHADASKSNYGSFEITDLPIVPITWSEQIEFERRLSVWAVENELLLSYEMLPVGRRISWVKAHGTWES